MPVVTPNGHGLGYKPDLPDFRDFLYAAPARVLKDLPAKTDLRPDMPKVYDQGQLGSCTANAIAGALEYLQAMQEFPAHSAPTFTPSRLFIYWNERAIEGSVGYDSGAYIRDGIKSVNVLGAPPETDWAYDINRFTEQPPQQAYTDALLHQALEYRRVARNLESMKACLASGRPFVFGFTVYGSFESDAVAKTGIVPLPKRGEDILGGHAVLACGYDDAKQTFTVRNSWGVDWGDGGYFFMPYTYLLHRGLSSDFWVIRKSES